jgi:hypothetical protein
MLPTLGVAAQEDVIEVQPQLLRTFHVVHIRVDHAPICSHTTFKESVRECEEDGESVRISI